MYDQFGHAATDAGGVPQWLVLSLHCLYLAGSLCLACCHSLRSIESNTCNNVHLNHPQTLVNLMSTEICSIHTTIRQDPPVAVLFSHFRCDKLWHSLQYQPLSGLILTLALSISTSAAKFYISSQAIYQQSPFTSTASQFCLLAQVVLEEAVALIQRISSVRCLEVASAAEGHGLVLMCS